MTTKGIKILKNKRLSDLNQRQEVSCKIDAGWIELSIDGKKQRWLSLDDFIELKNQEANQELKEFGIIHQDDRLFILQKCKSIIEKQQKKQTSGKEKAIEFTVPLLEKNGVLYEVVFDGEKSEFIWLEDGEIKTDRELVFGKIKYFPCCNEAVKKSAVILPKTAKEYENEQQLIIEIQGFIQKYLDVSPDYLIFASHYILLSWVQDKLTTVPYLRVLGDFSTGKSRFLDVIGKLCYKPIVAAGTITPAPLYRLQGVWHGTILIDEADRKKNDETSNEITKILNCGFEKNKPVLRCNKDNPEDVEVFDAFGCKVIASRFPFYDQALESRCLTERMKETSRTDIPNQLPPAFFDEQEQLRQKLLMFRLKNRANIDANTIQQIDLGVIENRLKQALSSFAVLFVNKPELLQRFRDFILQYQQELIEEREDSFDGKIINYLLERNSENDIENISPKDIAEEIAPTDDKKELAKEAANVGRHLKALGIIVKSKLVAGKTKRVIEWNVELMEKLFKKYNAEYWLALRNNRNKCNSRNSSPDLQQKQAKITDITDITDITESATKTKKEWKLPEIVQL